MSTGRASVQWWLEEGFPALADLIGRELAAYDSLRRESSLPALSLARSASGAHDSGPTIASVIDGDGWSGPIAVMREGKLEPFSPDGQSGRNSEPAVFEQAVFSYLFDHREVLGVRAVVRAKALRVDGLVELDDGRRIAIEVKYRLNWANATQALRQIEWFHNAPGCRLAKWRTRVFRRVLRRLGAPYLEDRPERSSGVAAFLTRKLRPRGRTTGYLSEL
jgi:hypothetical protein